MELGDMLRQSSVSGDGSSSAGRRSIDDPLWRLRLQAQEALFDRLGRRLFDPNLSEDQVRTYVVEQLEQILEVEVRQLTIEDRHELVESICHDLLGLGPIEPFLADPSVTEIMVNGDDAIYVERAGRIYLSDARFLTIKHLRQVIERIVASVGRRIDEASPMVDARLSDGSRVNAVIPPLSVDGPILTIRKFASTSFGARDLLKYGTLTPQSAEFLNVCVMGRRNILISGGTGTGKTTLLNVVSSFIPTGERIVTIEDAVELRLDQRHVVRLEARPQNIEGRGEITIRDLVRNALRMRPDRIIVGEVRGGEALDMLQAMNTGHEGSLSTLHANGPRDALSRLETMVLMSGMDLPMLAIREQMASAIDLIVHLNRLSDGSRRVIDISEITGMEGETITLSTLYRFDPKATNGEQGEQVGALVPTGLRPRFSEQLANMDIDLDEALLDPEPFADRVDRR